MKNLQTHPLFFSVLFLASTLSMSLFQMDGIIRNNNKNAFADEDLTINCSEIGDCFYEIKLPEEAEPVQEVAEPVVDSLEMPNSGDPDPGYGEPSTEALPEIPSTEEAPLQEECPDDSFEPIDENGPIVEPEYRGIFKDLFGTEEKDEVETCTEPEEETSTQAEDIDPTCEESTEPIFIDIDSPLFIADPLLVESTEDESDPAEEDEQKNILEEVKKETKQPKTRSIVFPKAPNTGRP